MNKNVARRRLRLTFPEELTDQPVLYRLVRDYNLVLNIHQARVLPDQRGVVTVELQGASEVLDQGVAFLEEMGIEVVERDRELGWDPDACVDCGACLPVCEPKALHRVEATGRVDLERDRCTLCEQCVQVCAYGAVWMER